MAHCTSSFVSRSLKVLLFSFSLILPAGWVFYSVVFLRFYVFSFGSINFILTFNFFVFIFFAGFLLILFCLTLNIFYVFFTFFKFFKFTFFLYLCILICF